MTKHINIDRPDNSELEDILTDVGKHAVWYSKNKYNKSPVSHDIGMTKHVALERLQALINKQIIEARKQTASDIFNLAHENAQADKTMVGSEELRNYHYYNAIHKIGEFDGR